MRKTEIIARLEAWADRQKALMAAYEAHRAQTGAMPDCPMWAPVFDAWMAYTVAVSELIGDKEEWLHWYENECDMGRRPMEVENLGGDVKIRVRTLKQLARVITWDA